jgi:hypothetical protein
MSLFWVVSIYISEKYNSVGILVKIHLEEWTLLAGMEQSRQAQLPCQPACFDLCPSQVFAL